MFLVYAIFPGSVQGRCFRNTCGSDFKECYLFSIMPTEEKNQSIKLDVSKIVGFGVMLAINKGDS